MSRNRREGKGGEEVTWEYRVNHIGAGDKAETLETSLARGVSRLHGYNKVLLASDFSCQNSVSSWFFLTGLNFLHGLSLFIDATMVTPSQVEPAHRTSQRLPLRSHESGNTHWSCVISKGEFWWIEWHLLESSLWSVRLKFLPTASVCVCVWGGHSHDTHVDNLGHQSFLVMKCELSRNHEWICMCICVGGNK